PGGPDPGPHRRGDLSSAAHPTPATHPTTRRRTRLGRPTTPSVTGIGTRQPDITVSRRQLRAARRPRRRQLGRGVGHGAGSASAVRRAAGRPRRRKSLRDGTRGWNGLGAPPPGRRLCAAPPTRPGAGRGAGGLGAVAGRTGLVPEASRGATRLSVRDRAAPVRGADGGSGWSGRTT